MRHFPHISDSPGSGLLTFLLTLTLVLPALGVASATNAGFDEAWEDGFTGWTVSGDGASIDCENARSGCSLLLDPPCCAEYTHVMSERSADVSSADRAVRFAFQGKLCCHTDLDVYFNLSNGHVLTVPLTYGYGAHVYVAMNGERGERVTTIQDERWYEAVIGFLPGRDMGLLEIHDDSGYLVGSTTFELPEDATHVEGVRFVGVKWGSTGYVRFDDLRHTDYAVAVPSAPLDASATAESGGHILLKWAKPALGPVITEYRVYRAANASDDFELVGEVEETWFHHYDAEPQHAYRYRITAMNLAGEGEGAVVDYVPPPVPGTPQDLRAAASSKDVVLTWSAPVPGDALDPYRVYRATDPAGPFEQVAAVRGTRYVDAQALPGAAYHYRVTAVNFMGEGEPAGACAMRDADVLVTAPCPVADDQSERVLVDEVVTVDSSPLLPGVAPRVLALSGAPSDDDPERYTVEWQFLDGAPESRRVFTAGALTEPVDVTLLDAPPAVVDVHVRVTARYDPALALCLVDAAQSCEVGVPVDPRKATAFGDGGARAVLVTELTARDGARGEVARVTLVTPFVGQLTGAGVLPAP